MNPGPGSAHHLPVRVPRSPVTPSIERFLMVGDEAALPLLRSLARSFPANARGNIFLELPDDRRPLLSAPPGITTSVLPRSLPSVLHAPGARACVGLQSWVGEWRSEERRVGNDGRVRRARDKRRGNAERNSTD